jgi:hypothetical protein
VITRDESDYPALPGGIEIMGKVLGSGHSCANTRLGKHFASLEGNFGNSATQGLSSWDPRGITWFLSSCLERKTTHCMKEVVERAGMEVVNSSAVRTVGCAPFQAA